MFRIVNTVASYVDVRMRPAYFLLQHLIVAFVNT